jgi:CHAT domain-containing protein
MPEFPAASLTPEQIVALLAQPAGEAQILWLQQAHLWDAGGLARLIEAGGQVVNNDLAQARQLLDLFIEVAPVLAPQLQPQAVYLRAQTFALDGDFDQALAQIAAARAGYEATGQMAAALRTNVGLLHVLIHLGRHQEALAAAADALDAVGQATSSLPAETIALLTALLQQNLGICYKNMGRYADAIDAYRAAEGHFDALERAEDSATIRMNLGVILAELGRGAEALVAYEGAAAVFRQTGNRMRQAQIMENLGELHQLLGNYSQSLAVLAEAGVAFAALDAPIELHVLERLTADAYLALNLLPEATAAYRNAIAGLEASDMPYDLAWALWGLGAALLRQQRLAEAGDALRRAADLFAEAENEHLRSAVLLEQAALAEAMGDRPAALAQTRQALALIGEQDWPVQRVYAHLRLADLLLPDTDAAEGLLLDARQWAEALALPHLRVHVQQRLGRLFLLQGRDAEAETILRAATGEIERLRGALARETVRASFLHDKTAVFEDLIRLYLARGDQESLLNAFSVAEQAKSRALVDLLTGAQDSEWGPDLDPELTHRLSALQADLNALYNQALSDSQEGDRSTRLAELNTRALDLEQKISRLLLQAGALATAPASLVQPLPVSALQTMLPPDLTVLAYHVLGAELAAFVYRDGVVQIVRNLSQTAVAARHLASLEIEWQRFQAGPTFVRRHLDQLTRSTQQVLQALYEALIAPVAKLLAGSARLAIIPHAALHHLPFAALFDGQSYLVDQFEITVAPSATVLSLCGQRPSQPAKQAVVFGVDDPLIPFARHEAVLVGEHVPDAHMYIGAQASLASLHAGTAGCGLLHLACHGLFRRDNPMFSALKLHDGWLTAGEVIKLKLPGAFVTLSACESGRSQVVGGDEPLGLPYAFLGAGATGLLVSLWLVDDETTAALMSHFYRELASRAGHAQALRRAQLALRSSHPHPYYWAPFVVVGRP